MSAAADRETPGELYEIRVRGHLDARAARWFEEMTITPLPGGETLLRGRVADQSALFGLLNRVRDLGLDLLSVSAARQRGAIE